MLRKSVAAGFSVVSPRTFLCACDRYENVNEAYLAENAAIVRTMHELVVKQWAKESR